MVEIIDKLLEPTERELNLIKYLRENGLPYGEMVVRFFYQDNVIVRMVEEEKRPSIKF